MKLNKKYIYLLFLLIIVLLGFMVKKLKSSFYYLPQKEHIHQKPNGVEDIYITNNKNITLTYISNHK